MSTVAILGVLATVSSLTIIVLGLPAQIIRNYRRQSCEGIDPKLIYSICVAYSIWSLYGWAKLDWPLAISQTPGAILAFVLLFQLIIYRR